MKSKYVNNIYQSLFGTENKVCNICNSFIEPLKKKGYIMDYKKNHSTAF